MADHRGALLVGDVEDELLVDDREAEAEGSAPRRRG